MLRSCDIPALSRLKAAAEERVAAIPSLIPLLLAGAGGLAVGSGLGAHAATAHEHESVSRARNTAFGAGMATGLAGPRLVSRLDARLNPVDYTPSTATEVIQ